jgi:thioredoxin 2
MSELVHVVCTACGAVNRIPPERNAADAKCGKCGVRLFSGHPAEVDWGNLQRQIEKGTLPTLVDVWAPWCGPCRAMAPEFEKAALAGEPKLRFVKLNSDEEQAAAGRLGIRSIPTLLLFHHGREAGRISGALSATQIRDWTAQQMGAANTGRG